MKLTLPILLLALATHGQPMPMAAPVPPRVHYHLALVPKQAPQLAARPALVGSAPAMGTISWQYTNAFFAFDTSTDLVNWVFYTNVPMSVVTNFSVPMNQPRQFFRAYTVLLNPNGFYTVQSMNLITNLPQ